MKDYTNLFLLRDLYSQASNFLKNTAFKIADKMKPIPQARTAIVAVLQITGIYIKTNPIR